MSTSVVFQLNQTGTWFENLAVRPNGQIVATRMDLGQLWLIDPFAKTGKKLVDVPGVISTIGIAEYKPDVFAFGGGNFSLNPVSLAAGSMKVFSLNLTKELPVVTLITPLPDAGFANGLTAWSETEVLVADTNGGTVYKVDITTGNAAIIFSGEDFVGVNGLRVQNGYLYYSSTDTQRFFRVPVGADAMTAGPVEVLTSGFPQDDFALAADDTAYIAGMERNQLIQVLADGQTTTIAGEPDNLEVAASTSARFGRTPVDSNVLYVTTSGGALQRIFGNYTEPAKIVAVKLNNV
ncbi:hypothetical protein K4K56_002811 [Colletotrichum sp. SAR 10_98]|nr:hypothetical protein K4K56_002811 [Colletotrichum sp. SAR 10_98]